MKKRQLIEIKEEDDELNNQKANRYMRTVNYEQQQVYNTDPHVMNSGKRPIKKDQRSRVYRSINYPSTAKKQAKQYEMEEQINSSESSENEEEILQKKKIEKFQKNQKKEKNDEKGNKNIFSFNETKRNIFKQRNLLEDENESKARAHSIIIKDSINGDDEEEENKSKVKKKFRSVQFQNNKKSFFKTENFDEISPLNSDSEDDDFDISLGQEYQTLVSELNEMESSRLKKKMIERKKYQEVYIEKKEDDEKKYFALEIVRKLRLKINVNHYSENLGFLYGDLRGFRSCWKNFGKEVNSMEEVEEEEVDVEEEDDGDDLDFRIMK